MLDPKSLDLDELCAALEDHSPDATWWIHTDDGRIRSGGPGGAGWIAIGSVGSHRGLPRHGRVRRGRAPPPGRRAAGPRDRGARRVPPVQGHPLRVPRAARAVVPLPRRPLAAAGRAVAGRRRADRARGRHRVDGALPRPDHRRRGRARRARRRPRPALRRPAAARGAVRRLGPRGGRGRGRHRGRRRAGRPALPLGRAQPHGRRAVAARRAGGLAVVAVPVTAEEWAAPDNPLLRRAAAEAVQLA